MTLKVIIPKESLDYIEIYAKALKENPKHFKEQKMLIESQLNSSKELFMKRFGKGKIFRFNARRYLENIGRL